MITKKLSRATYPIWKKCKIIDMRRIAEILQESYSKKFGPQQYRDSAFKRTYGAVAALAMTVFGLESRIQERKDIIYVIEMDLMDNEEIYSEDYRAALRDEIDNHNAFMSNLEQELTSILENT